MGQGGHAGVPSVVDVAGRSGQSPVDQGQRFDQLLAGGGGIDTDFSVPDLALGLDSPIQGRLRIELADIEPVLLLVAPEFLRR